MSQTSKMPREGQVAQVPVPQNPGSTPIRERDRERATYTPAERGLRAASNYRD